MSYETEYLDYEDMDDLVLPDHIEYDCEQLEEFTLEALDVEYVH